MRIFFDHCVPRTLRNFLSAHQVRTTREEGWEDLNNGVLMGRAAASFDVFITVDQNIEYQQNLTNIPLSVIVLVAPDNRTAHLRPLPHSLNKRWPRWRGGNSSASM